jgi:hypothetical protein
VAALGLGSATDGEIGRNDKVTWLAVNGAEVIILDSARKHGIDDEDISHAIRNNIRSFGMEEGITMVIGPGRHAQILEVGLVESVDGDLLVVHAMPARDKFLR